MFQLCVPVLVGWLICLLLAVFSTMSKSKAPTDFAGDCASVARSVGNRASAKPQTRKTNTRGATPTQQLGRPGKKQKAEEKRVARQAEESQTKQSNISLPGLVAPDLELDRGPKIRDEGVEITCGKCGVKSIPSQGIPLCINACEKCYGPMPAFHALGFSFVAMCGQAHADAQFSEDYDKAATYLRMDPAQRPWGPESIVARKKVGIEVAANFDGKDAVSMMAEDTKGVDLEAVGMAPSSIPSPFGVGTLDNMVVTRREESFISIKMYTRIEFDDEVVNMSAQDRITPGQPATISDQLQKALHDALPVAVRGNRFPPTMSFLRKKAEGILSASSTDVASDTNIAMASSANIGRSSATNASKPMVPAFFASPTPKLVRQTSRQVLDADDLMDDSPRADGSDSGGSNFISPSKAPSMISKTVMKKGSEADRAAELHALLKSSLALMGKGNGNDVYAARRFEEAAEDPNLISEVRRIRLRYETAGSIQLNVLSKLDPAFVNAQLNKLIKYKQTWDDVDVYCLALVKFRINNTKDPEEIAETVDYMPMEEDEFNDTEEVDDSRARFDPLLARLSDIPAVEPLIRVTRFIDIASSHIIQPLLRREGNAASMIVELYRAFGAQWQVVYDSQPDNDDDQVLKSGTEDFHDILLLLLMLMDNSILLLLKVKSKATLNKFLAGTLHAAWKACLLEMEDSKFWAPRLQRFARHRIDEAEHVMKVKLSIDSLESADVSNFRPSVQDAIKLALQVEPLSRENSIACLWDAMKECLDRCLTSFIDSDDSKELDKVRDMDYWIDN
jgi:hypothetical protein